MVHSRRHNKSIELEVRIVVILGGVVSARESAEDFWMWKFCLSGDELCQICKN